jgi:hypothetical protein
MADQVEVPGALQDFMYGLMKMARRESFVEFCEYWGINYETDYPKIKEWFEQFGIKL